MSDETPHDGSTRPRPSGLLALVGPGLLVAATGVGAGDLAGAGLAGTRLGYAVLWAVVLGAAIKYVLTEGLARWQLATGTTLLEGAGAHLGRRVVAGFVLLYFLLWSYVVSGAMMSGCGVAAQSLLPIETFLGQLENPAETGKVVYGILHSAVGVALVWIGGFKLFERVMAVCIALMFFTVVVTAVMIGPDWPGVARGLLVPTIPIEPGALGWTIALVGGVGGTVTLLAYGYWIRESGRDEPGALGACRLDIAVGYSMTAIFGVALVVIATGVEAGGSGMGLIVALADRLGSDVGPAAQWIFLVGAWGAVASSLLGVWQSVPYLFADAWRIIRCPTNEELIARRAIDTRSWIYRGFLLGLATIPIFQLWRSFAGVQKVYAITGAAFLPLLALSLLLLNTRRAWIGVTLRNRWPSTIALILVLLFSTFAGALSIQRLIAPPSTTPDSSVAPDSTTGSPDDDR